MQEPCQEQEMYQRDNSQKRQTESEKEKERKKERNDRERERQREGGRDRGRGHTEPTGGGLRPESAPSHTQMSPHKYVLGVYVKEMNLSSYLHSCVCEWEWESFQGEVLLTVWHTWVRIVHTYIYREREKESENRIHLETWLLHNVVPPAFVG